MTKDKKTSLFVRWDEIRKRNDVSSVSIAMNKRNERGKEGEKKGKKYGGLGVENKISRKRTSYCDPLRGKVVIKILTKKTLFPCYPPFICYTVSKRLQNYYFVQEYLCLK